MSIKSQNFLKTSEKLNHKDINYILKYTKVNIKRTRITLSYLKPITFIAFFVTFFGLACFIAYIITKISNENLLILVLLAPIIAMLSYVPILNQLEKRKNTIIYLTDIITAINASPIVFYDNSCFEKTSPEQSKQIVCSLIANNQITGSETVGMLIAKKELKMTPQDADCYASENQNKTYDSKKVIIKLPDVDPDNSCDNCGHPFAEDEAFCGQCGTMRKDLRKRV